MLLISSRHSRIQLGPLCEASSMCRLPKAGTLAAKGRHDLCVLPRAVADGGGDGGPCARRPAAAAAAAMQPLVNRSYQPSPQAMHVAIGADLAVGTEQGNPQLAGLGHQEAIGGIGVERLRQAGGCHGHGDIQG